MPHLFICLANTTLFVVKGGYGETRKGLKGDTVIKQEGDFFRD